MKYINSFLLISYLMSPFAKAEFLKGVNYGNRFIPEDWMTGDGSSIYGDHYGDAVQTPNDVERVSLCDVTDDRILHWLDDTVLEEDFVKMQEYGVKLLRVPTGYWNWVDLGDLTPNAPDNVAARFRNLQSVKPSQYEPYINKIFEFAQKYGLKLLPELHGAPGSQNGEIHSGCVTGPEINGKPEHYFNTDWNKQIAVDSVGKMAEKCSQYPGVCWGVGVLNEPQPSGNGAAPNDDQLHEFLDQFYDEAIRRVRESLSWDMPVVLFSWTYDFNRWPDQRYSYDQYGSIVWDTHTYTPGSDNLDTVLSFYDWDLLQISNFQNRQAAPVLIGEFAFSNLNRGDQEREIWQEYVDRIFPKFQQKVQGWALIWNFDCQDASWSMEGLAETMHVQWNLHFYLS